jgi:hypothetical protein
MNRGANEVGVDVASVGPNNEPGDGRVSEPPTRSFERAGPRFSIAALSVAFGAALMVLGSFLRWATFKGTLGLADVSGIEMGYGVATLLIGAVVGLIGLDAVRTGGVSRFRWWAMMSAVGGFVMVALGYVFLALRIVELEYGSFAWPEDGLFVVGVGAAVAAIAAFRLQALQPLE